jgi:hypothetical protein
VGRTQTFLARERRHAAGLVTDYPKSMRRKTEIPKLFQIQTQFRKERALIASKCDPQDGLLRSSVKFLSRPPRIASPRLSLAPDAGQQCVSPSYERGSFLEHPGGL